MWIKGNTFRLTEVWTGTIVATCCEEACYGHTDLTKPNKWKLITCIADEHDVKVMRYRGQIIFK